MPATKPNRKLSPQLNFWLPVFACMVFIFCLSSLPGKDIPALFPYQDVVAHILIYALLGYSFIRAAKHSKPESKFIKLILVTLVFCVLYGISDEWHQSFVPGRLSEVSDVVNDGLGGLLGALIFLAEFLWLR